MVDKSKIQSVVMISDVSVGYGTPQILSLAKSLVETYGCELTILEPDQPERPSTNFHFNGITIERIFTATHPYTPSGQVEFNIIVSKRIDELKPEAIILCAFLGAGALLKIKHKSKINIYFGLEHTDDKIFEKNMIKQCSSKIDMSIFPEENRALLDLPRINLNNKPYVIAYNGSSSNVEPVSINEKNKKIFYGGLLHPELTFSNYFFDGQVDSHKIDLFGIIDGYPNKEEVIQRLKNRKSNVQYGGYLTGGDSFINLLKYYDYSIVLWNPRSESTLYAAPNKFFDAIQAGVPIISAPHPLCVKLINRYKCGIVMGGFGQNDLKLALRDAAILRKSDEYKKILEEYLPVARKDLCWDTQFLKIKSMLDGLLKNK